MILLVCLYVICSRCIGTRFCFLLQYEFVYKLLSHLRIVAVAEGKKFDRDIVYNQNEEAQAERHQQSVV